MKKYLLTMAVMAIFAIGFAASDEEDSSKGASSSTEQKQESPAEKEAREKQEKINKVAKMAYQKGYDVRKETWGQSISPESSARLEYTFRYSKEPEDAGQNERWNVFLENFKKGFADAAHDIMKKMDEENF